MSSHRNSCSQSGAAGRAPDGDRARRSRRYPYERVAAAVASQIEVGALIPGEPAPTAAELANEHGVSVATAKRSLVAAQEWGLLERTSQTCWRGTS